MAGQSPRTRTPGPDPKPGNADPDPARNSKRNRTPELDRLLLESSEFLRWSLRNQVPPEPEIGRGGDESRARKRVAKGVTWTEDLKEVNGSSCFVGDPVPVEEAKRRWPHRYENKVKICNNWRSISNIVDDDEIILKVKYHYLQANVSGCILNIGDCVYVKGEKRKPNYIGTILEFFETVRGEYFVRVRWFFRAEDTVLQDQAASHDKKRLFYSDLSNDNLLNCIVSKVKVLQIPSSIHINTAFPSSSNKNLDLKPKSIPSSYFYYDMRYSVDYSTFQTMDIYDSVERNDLSSSNCLATDHVNDTEIKAQGKQIYNNSESKGTELSLLDLYSGCGGMSTGLCLGAQVAGVKLVTRWAVDSEEAACVSLKLNHPETEVRIESAVDFYELLKEWDILCKRYIFDADKRWRKSDSRKKEDASKMDTDDNLEATPDEYEVSRLVDICYGDPSESGERSLKFKVRWKGYDPDEDTWEPIDNLRCRILLTSNELAAVGFRCS